MDGVVGPNSESHLSNDHFILSLISIELVVPEKTIFNEFPVGSYVKLNYAVATILVDGRGHRIQF